MSAIYSNGIYYGSGLDGHSVKSGSTTLPSESSMNFIDADLSDNLHDKKTLVRSHRLIDAEKEEIFSGTKPGNTLVDVVANPVGTPTASLEKLKIGNTIYDFAGAGLEFVELFKGYESAFKQTYAGRAVNLNTHTQTALFDTYIQTSDYTNFTIKKSFFAFCYLGVRQGGQQSIFPDTALFVNNVAVGTVMDKANANGSKMFNMFFVNFNANDSFFVGSVASQYYPVRLIQIFLVDGPLTLPPVPDYN